ncbi:MAG: S8 family serine peptidase [Pseudomonadota bacterium]
MVTYQYRGKDGKQFKLDDAKDTLVVRTQRRVRIERLPLSKRARSVMSELSSVLRLPAAGVEVLKCSGKISRDEARAVLKKEEAMRFAGRNLMDPASKTPVLYTENFFVKFADDVKLKDCKKLFSDMGLKIKRALGYAQNAFFVSAKEGSGQAVFDMAQDMLHNKEIVQLCHPELVRRMAYRGAFPQQWHLKSTTINGRRVTAHAAVESAWELSQGEGAIIAIIDDGLDMTHEEFSSSGKIVAPRDATAANGNPTPHNGDDHGTACAGVACADGNFGAAGVAPKARIMPIRLASGLGAQAEADAFVWAAQHGADVISCSWGPEDGDWSNPNDPVHKQKVPLPDSTRLAIDWAIRNGRNGKGCLITWAAGNGGESVENDGYASYDNVIAVAACNDQSTRSVYSDTGASLWCSFPSSDLTDTALTPGIWTTDRSGREGYNPGDNDMGDTGGNYTNSFGGTSSACPGAAGVAALVIARNPHLRWDEVKDILRRSCDKIDNSNGNYDAQGHSALYGYGRLNARRAVELAMPSRPQYIAIHTAVQDVAIKDLKKSTLTVKVGDDSPIQSIKVIVDIEHSYIGDLVVKLVPPTATGIAKVMLHDRFGGGTDNIKRSFDMLNAPDLGKLVGKNPQGAWTLEVEDKAKSDQGMIRKFTVEIGY